MTIQQNYPAIKPTLNLDFANTKQLDPRITYSRASTGTYYDGKTVAKAEENLLVRSQEFSSASWFKFGIVATADTTVAPDGTSTADTLTPTASAGRHITYQSYVTASAGQVFTLSVYVKPNGHNYVALGFEPNTNGVAKSFIFDLSLVSAAVLHNSGENVFANASATITSAGNGWFRCTMTSTSVAALSNFLTIQFGSSPIAAPAVEAGMPTFTGDGTSGVYLWGAQLEQRSTATAYTPTTTAPITNYIPVLQTASAGTPRFDHNPITGESLGLLIEEQRTNLLLRSEEFDNAYWGKTNTTVTANTVVSPDGTTDAETLSDGVAAGLHYTESTAQTLTGAHTASIYAKKGTSNFIGLYAQGLSQGAFFNLNTGAFSSNIVGAPTSYSIVAVGNGWYRCTITFTAAATSLSVRLFTSTDGTTFNYTGNNNTVFIWGAQLEAGAFATSYIPTVASQVTRAADSASMTGTNFSSWYNQSEGSIYQDLTSLGVNAVDRYSLIISATGSVGANSHNIRNYNGVQVAQSLVNSTVQGEVTLPPGVVAGVPIRLIYAYKTNDFAGVKNGGSIVVDTAGIVPTGLTRLDLPGDGCNHLKKLSYYPRRLTNTQIQALTS